MATVIEKKPVSPSSIARPATRGMSNGSERIHYLDNLRALAMMLGVFLHGAFAYANPSQTFWLATDPQSSVAIDAAIWFVHLFRMALFFLVAGYFAKLVLVRNGMKRMLWQRTIRLVFPFLLFYPFLLAAMTILIVFGLSYVEEPRGLMGLIAETSKQSSGSEGGPAPGPMHLWFLYYLIFFTLIGAIASRFPIPKLLRSGFNTSTQREQVNLGVHKLRIFIHSLARRACISGFETASSLFRRPWLFALVPLILLPGIVGAGVPVPGPESFVPMWWPFAFYGPFYLAGWHWYGREQTLEKIRPYVWYIVAGSLLLFVPYYMSMPVLDLRSLIQDANPRPLWTQGIACLLTAYLSVALTAASLLLGKQFLSRPSARLKFLADSSYWVYLIHLPIVLFLQTLFIPFEWNVWLKVSVTLIATFLFCMATYVVFVRYTPVGWLLHGKRSFP